MPAGGEPWGGLSLNYKNNQSCTTFLVYIAQDLKESLTRVLAQTKFFSFQS